MNIRNAVVLVTGAAAGIGRAIALAFDREGARVAIADLQANKLPALAAGMRDPLILPTDVSDPDQVRSMVRKTIEHYGRIDILVNDAAAIIVSRADELSPDDLMRSFRTNVLGPMVAANTALPQMRKQGYGHIINIGSPGYMIGVPLYAAYASSKGGLSGWTRTVQAEWAGSGIVVSEYFPGYTKTESRPESKYEGVEQDLIIDPRRNAVSKFFTRPATPEGVALKVVALAKRPRPLVYTSFLIKIGSFIALFPRVRISVAVQLALAVRRRLGISQFSGE